MFASDLLVWKSIVALNRTVSPLHKPLLLWQSKYVLDMTTLGIWVTNKLTLRELYAKTWQAIVLHVACRNPDES